MEFWIPLERYQRSHPGKYRALYQALKDALRSGEIPPGTRLPSSRDLANEYGLARGTVIQAYEMLAADGYLETRRGRGTFVAAREFSRTAAPGKSARLKLSRWVRRVPEPPAPVSAERIRYDLRLGRPDPEIFPERKWRRAMMEAFRRQGGAERTRHEPSGVPDLRAAIAVHLNQRRGLNIDADQVEVVSGSQQALGLLVQILVDPGDPVVLENPGYFGIRNAVLAAGGRPRNAPVDEDGIRISDWDARLLVVTPSHQFPTGSRLSLDRRRRILAWARGRNAIIIEDDYDSEFKREGRPVEPLKSMDLDGRVIYTGTFSKTIHSGVRLGYVVLPPSLRDPFRRARRLYEANAPSRLEQTALGSFIKSGEYEKHLRRSSRVYRQRYESFLSLFEKHLPGCFRWNPSNAGLHLFGTWRDDRVRLDVFADACLRAGVIWTRADFFYQGKKPDCALFGYSHLNETRAAKALALMGRVYRDLE